MTFLPVPKPQPQPLTQASWALTARADTWGFCSQQAAQNALWVAGPPSHLGGLGDPGAPYPDKVFLHIVMDQIDPDPFLSVVQTLQGHLQEASRGIGCSLCSLWDPERRGSHLPWTWSVLSPGNLDTSGTLIIVRLSGFLAGGSGGCERPWLQMGAILVHIVQVCCAG